MTSATSTQVARISCRAIITCTSRRHLTRRIDAVNGRKFRSRLSAPAVAYRPEMDVLHARSLAAAMAIAGLASACEPAPGLDASPGDHGAIRDRTADRGRDRDASKRRPTPSGCAQLKPPRPTAT